MKKELLKIKKKWIIVALSAFVIVLTLYLARTSFAVLLEDDVEVAPNSELTYYLNVSYDGVDRDGQVSSDTKISEINSGKLYVEDKLPDGLIFEGFVTTSDGSIGAYKRNDGTSCAGSVIDDTNEEMVDTGVWNADRSEYTYHGLHYYAATNTVTFTIKNLKAGCNINVGIKTRTPEIDDPLTPEKETRRDFYNFATSKEKDLQNNSNTVHVFMGKQTQTTYTVHYEYEGDIPENVPTLPNDMSYAAGASVSVANNIKMEGYTFNGFRSDDVTLTNQRFIMPASNVTLKGSFSKINTKKVTYQLEGSIPPDYVLPIEKEYYPASTVEVDSLKEGDIFNGYRFLGWESSDVLVSEENDFIMPEKNVIFTGKFVPVTYQVNYQFYDTILPPDANTYLPQSKSYQPGSKVILEDISGNPTGYKFLGWYKEKEFEMPNEDVTIYGEWKIQNGTFEPTITKEIVAPKNYYIPGDVVKFKITITNTANFPITDVIVQENTDAAMFIEGNGYTVKSNHVANVARIEAGTKVDLYATYTISIHDKKELTNEVELTGALAENYYELYDKKYIATANFKVASTIKICKKIDGIYVPNVFQFSIESATNHYQTWLTLENDQCQMIYVEPSTYKIKEVIPQEYEIKEITGAIHKNGENLIVEENKDYSITYTNIFKKKGFFHSFGRKVNKIMKKGQNR